MTYLTKAFFICLASSVFFNQSALACDHCDHNEHEHKHGHDHGKEAKVNEKANTKQTLFGSKINPKTEKVELAKLIAEPSQHYHKTVQVQGTVDQVCTEKGCWLALKNGDRDMRVKFKDYGFFVPQNIRGKNVMVEGELVEKSVDEQIEGTQDVKQKKQVFFVASGVQII